MATAERGIALVVVLWAITLLAVIAASFAYTVRIESTLAANLVGRAKARALAEAGIAYAVFDLLRPLQLRQLTPDGTSYPWESGAGIVTISVRDASGLIDLNTASRDLLGGLLAAAGVAEEKRNPLLDAIEDWRDPDDVPLLQGAEDKNYIAAGLPYGAKDGPFEDVTELQQVLGVSLELYRRIEKSLTVFSGQTGIDPAMASREILLAVPGIDPRLIEAYVQERRERQAMGATPPLPPIGAEYLASAGGLAYSVRAEAKIAGEGTAIIEAVISPSVSNMGGVIPNSSVFEWRSL
ncbi:MAG: type II secretion system minor pseudopilin [Candidatus Nitrosoglobus sp.]